MLPKLTVDPLIITKENEVVLSRGNSIPSHGKILKDAGFV